MLKKDLQPEFVLSLCEDSEKVMQFLADVKWETGFVCRGCGHTNYCSGKPMHPGAVRSAKKKSLQQPILFFTTANFLSTRLFQSSIPFVSKKEK